MINSDSQTYRKSNDGCVSTAKNMWNRNEAIDEKKIPILQTTHLNRMENFHELSSQEIIMHASYDQTKCKDKINRVRVCVVV